jgi:hypothetical protein
MVRRRAFGLIFGVAIVLVAVAGSAGAAPPEDLSDDGTGKRWRQVTETLGLSWEQVAAVCPQDGATPCSGAVGTKNLSGWVWASPEQVRDLFGLYDPAILTADPPVVTGVDQFGTAMGFLADMRPTLSVDGYGFHAESASGWTAGTGDDGHPIGASSGFGWWPPSGSFSVASTAGKVTNWYGVWLWRPASDDITPPAVASALSGTLGSNGWYVSDVEVSWTVVDPESVVSSQTGCDPTAVVADTASTTFTCEATSAGGTTAASVNVKRDVTPPAVACPAPPPVFEQFQIGGVVRAAVADETSGPLSPIAQAAASTGVPGTFAATVTGVDRAGNRTTARCTYVVAAPTCRGEAATILGTASNNVINGTAGRDVIAALGGADTVYGRGGDDVICGGDGPDTIEGGDGDDYLDGGPGSDSLRGDSGRDTCLSGEVRRSSCEL